MPKSKVTVHNKISDNYRQIHVDGAFGGITPRGLINLSFYAERSPIPRATDFEVTETGIVGKELGHSQDSKTGILREFEMGIYMDLNTAKSIVQFLSGRISDLEKVIKQNNERLTN